MEEYKLFDAEYKFMDIIWEKEPINSTELVKETNKRLGWKKSTTYTMLRKLGEKKLIKSENAIVEAIVKKEDIQKYESEVLLEKSFDSSLPAFISTFLKDRKLTQKEANEIKKILEGASK